MSYTLSLEIKGLPKLPNTLLYRHWRYQQTEKNRWKSLVMLQAVRFKPPQPLTSAALTLTRISSREPDAEALILSFKHVVDGLVECGVIVDDKPSVIGTPTYLWEKTSPRNGHIRITVRERAV